MRVKEVWRNHEHGDSGNTETQYWVEVVRYEIKMIFPVTQSKRVTGNIVGYKRGILMLTSSSSEST